MKIFSAKKIERTFFQITYCFKSETYKREFLLLKKATVTLFGFIPLYNTKTICVKANNISLK